MEVKMEEQVRADDHNHIHKEGEEEEEEMLMKQQRRQPQQLQLQRPQISEMKPVTEGAYGGGLYGTEKGMKPGEDEYGERRRPASETQSADGPVEHNSSSLELKHKPPPPSSGDRDIDITGQSYIQ